MRLFLDLQAIQGVSSKRGIGRYSFELAKAIVRTAGDHEVWLGFSDRLSVPWRAIEEICADRVPRDRVTVIALPGQSAELPGESRGRARVSELIREAGIAELQPDVVHVSSLFEGLIEDNATSVGAFPSSPPTSVTLYDLIPYMRPETYLTGTALRRWYLRKIDSLVRADRLLAISESAKREAVAHLKIPEHRISVAYAGVSEFFRPMSRRDPELADGLKRLGLTHPFALYTGGVEPRKNIEGMIAAFAALPGDLMKTRQLAIVCAVPDLHRERLGELARAGGMEPWQLVLTGFVSDLDLRILYSACELFVFPSLHEGFGLPIVEAMACGAPVIGSATSSIPEIIARSDALFDPTRATSITVKMEEVLRNPAFAKELKQNGEVQARRFTWDGAARSAWTAFEAMLAARAMPNPVISLSRKTKLAYFSPLPPEPTGISDYSSELLPELAEYYDITLVVTQEKVRDPWITANLRFRELGWFERNAHRFDRILYNLGNSLHHAHVPELIQRWPGVVILHDFYLSALFQRLGSTGDPAEWFRRLYDSHGIHAVRAYPTLGDSEAGARALPCSRFVVERATAVIVHSQHARDLVRRFFGERAAGQVTVMPFPRRLPDRNRRADFRRELGLADGDILVCSFGFLAETKLNHRLIEAWRKAGLDRRRDCQLRFVGNLPAGPSGARIIDLIGRGTTDRIGITGFVQPDAYQGYLDACDLAVQLRSSSRGEFPASAMDCLAHGTALIINTHGSLAEIPADGALRIPGDFSDDELAAALLRLIDYPSLRRRLAGRGRADIEAHHQPRAVARELRDLIESCGQQPNARLNRLLSDIGDLPVELSSNDLAAAAAAAAANRRSMLTRELLVDVSEIRDSDPGAEGGRIITHLLDQLTRRPPILLRPEPVTVGEGRITYARSFASRHFGLPSLGRDDAPARLQPGDEFLALSGNPETALPTLELLRRRNIAISAVLCEMPRSRQPEAMGPLVGADSMDWLQLVATYADRVICIAPPLADQFSNWFAACKPARFSPLRIEALPGGPGSAYPTISSDDGKERAGRAEIAGQLTALLYSEKSDEILRKVVLE